MKIHHNPSKANLSTFFFVIVSLLIGLFAGVATSKVANINLFPDRVSPDIYAQAPNSNSEDIKWAEKILKNEGKYILWFRHGEREKWTGTVTVFDYFDVTSNSTKDHNNWRPAVCLTPKGRAEAELVGVTFKKLRIEPSQIVSSLSCRAKETALAAFNRIDKEWLEVLHPTAVPANQQVQFAQTLKEKLMTLSTEAKFQDGPVIVTGHGNTLPFYQKELFVESHVENWTVNELGFIVIEVKTGGLVAQHSFIDFYQFANNLLRFDI